MKKNNKGFTLIEIIIVIVILGILATLAVPRIVGQMEASRSAEALQFFGAIRRAVQNCVDLSATNTVAVLNACNMSAELGVNVPAGASYVYQSADTAVVGQLDFRAERAAGTDAICMRMTFDANGATTGVDYNVNGTVYVPVVSRIEALTAAITCNADLGNNPI